MLRQPEAQGHGPPKPRVGPSPGCRRLLLGLLHEQHVRGNAGSGERQQHMKEAEGTLCNGCALLSTLPAVVLSPPDGMGCGHRSEFRIQSSRRHLAWIYSYAVPGITHGQHDTLIHRSSPVLQAQLPPMRSCMLIPIC